MVLEDINSYKYDYYFISYSSKNRQTAEKVMNMLETHGKQCFFAPRDIEAGTSYAGAVIKAINKCDALLLILTQAANESVQVLREVNAAVSRKKAIIPLKFEQVKLNDDLQYYLGVAQYIDATKELIDDQTTTIEKLVSIQKDKVSTTPTTIQFNGTQVIDLEKLLNSGFTASQIAMREIEIDYLCIPQDRYTMNEDLEGSLSDWCYAIEHMEYETSGCLVKNDNIIGYCDIYPVKEEAYKQLIDGECIIRDDMIEIYGFGGVFSAYIAMIAIIPEEEGFANYYRMFDWLFGHIAYWKNKHIELSKIGISVYSDLLEQFILKLGFNYVGYNPAKGKIYETDYKKLADSDAIKGRYENLAL